MITLTHKEMTKQIRGRLKQAGIKARCRLYTACGINYVQIFVIKHGLVFTSKESRVINVIAHANCLTMSRGSEIDLNHPFIDFPSFDFEFHGN